QPCRAKRARPVLPEQELEVGDRPALGTLDPRALRHPSNLRRNRSTRSIRATDLVGSHARMSGMKRLALPFLLLVLIVPGAAHAAACSPLNCAPSQFLFGNGTLLGFRSAVDKPLRVIDLRTGKTTSRLPAGIVSGNTL